MTKRNSISPAKSTQSQTSPGLYIVATPIGNLRDITLRALDVLKSADHILAEDTRQTRKLLEAYDIEGGLIAYHDHNVAKMLPKVMEWLGAGKVIAQVSDAGTPLVSDPGYKLVRAAIEAGHDVFPVPGASAPMAALVAAGLPSDRFFFGGFLPNKSAARRSILIEFLSLKSTLIFFESPNRIVDSLSDMKAVLGDRDAVLARELTKKFEQIRRGSLSDLISSCEEVPPKGEIVVLIGPPAAPQIWSPAEVDAALKQKLPELGAKRASAEIANSSGWAKRNVYQRAILLSS